MLKIHDDPEFVSYAFYMKIEDEAESRKYGAIRVIGFCNFNRKDSDCKLGEKSDNYFFENKKYFDCVYMKLIQLSDQGKEFPNETYCEVL